tara:strand:- start:11711 stop:12256 length:546 start_codon:yes stop_codon:yes gene_type:complete
MNEKFYHPAEDSSLLAKSALNNVEKNDVVLDVGTGSGFVASKIKKNCFVVIGCDINPHACKHVKKNKIEVIRSNLMDAFKPNSFDLILFNAPYLPGDGHKFEEWFEVATIGGETGREVIKSFINGLGRVLSKGGCALLLASTKTGISEIETYAKEKNFNIQIIEKNHYYEETLVVFRITPV